MVSRFEKVRQGWLEELRYFLRVLPVVAVLSLLLLPIFLGAKRARQDQNERLLPVRIFLQEPGDAEKLSQLGVRELSLRAPEYVDAAVTGGQLVALRQAGFQVALIVEVDTTSALPEGYPRQQEVDERIARLAVSHAHIARRFEIGRSARWQLPIWALKISDNPALDEDEPSVLLTGGIHAREPLGMLTCLQIAEELCRRYETDRKVREWVNELQIYIVPLANPDGYRYVIDERPKFPWWRKNLADNDGDGLFDPEKDGVDLNRNFGFNWAEGGSDDPHSWFYRGPRAFSEPETRALRDLALQIRPVAGISYHSHGEAVLYPWSNYPRPADWSLIQHMAFQMASLIGTRRGTGHYAALPLNGRVGQSSCWLYAALGCLDFTVEVGDEYFPETEDVPKIVREAVKAAYFLFDRVRGSALWLRVTDAVSASPLVAEVRVEELGEGDGSARMTDPFFGRVRWLLEPGTYHLVVSAPGRLAVRREVHIDAGKPTDLTVGLVTASQALPLGNQ